MSSTASPRISVCIPTFNGANTIEETVNSVLGQSISEIELIICDDGSTDQTIQRLATFSDARLKIYHLEKLESATDNWNRALGFCSGEFIKVMGQDDILYPNCLETELLALAKFNFLEPTFVYSRRNIILENGTRIKIPRPFNNNRIRPSDSRRLLRGVIRSGRNPIGEPVAVTFRRDAVLMTEGFRGSYVIDLDMWFQLLMLGPAIKVNHVLTAFRVSHNSWSFRLRRIQARETIELYDKIAAASLIDDLGLSVFIGKQMAHLMQFLRRAFLFTLWIHQNRLLSTLYFLKRYPQRDPG